MIRERTIPPETAPSPEPAAPSEAGDDAVVLAPWGSPQAEVGRQLAFTAKLTRGWFDARLTDEGGSLTTWIVLSGLSNADERLSQSELATRMSIGGPTLVRHIDRLEAEGLVTRRRDDRDRRVTRLDITPAGRERHRQLARVSLAANDELRALITDDEEAVLRSVLQRFADHVLTSRNPGAPAAPDDQSPTGTDPA